MSGPGSHENRQIFRSGAFYFPFFSRWKQPAQQHGRRLPSANSVWTLSTRRFLVSINLAVSTQQIHSLRANGVMSAQAARAWASDSRARRRSTGSLCTVPLARDLFIMLQL